MRTRAKRVIHRFNIFLSRPIVVIFTLLILFAYFAYGNAQFQKDNRVLLTNTFSIVAKQDQTLDAIKSLSLDNKLSSKQLGDTIICMLLVPVSERTPDTQESCRKEAIARTPASASSGSTPSQPVTNTPKSTSTPQQTNTATPEPEKVEVLGVPLCVPLLGLCVTK